MRTVVLRRRDGAALSDNDAIAAFNRCTYVKVEQAIATTNAKEVRCHFSKWREDGKAAAAIHDAEFDAVVDALRNGERTTVIVRNLPFRRLRCAPLLRGWSRCGVSGLPGSRAMRLGHLPTRCSFKWPSRWPGRNKIPMCRTIGEKKLKNETSINLDGSALGLNKKYSLKNK